MKKARQRYNELSSAREQFLESAYECAELTIPTLIMRNENTNYQSFVTPWQSVGAKGVVTLSSKLMLGLLPPSTTFFKLQLDDSKLGVEIPAEMKSELDLSFAKIERMIMESIAASTDRVQIFAALKHLVVTGNALLFMGKDGMKVYPLNRYCVERDGNGEVMEIVTKERVSKKLLDLPEIDKQPNTPNDDDQGDYNGSKDVDVYTCVKRDEKGWYWYQEANGMTLPDSQGKAPLDKTPWLPLRFVTVDGEDYGRSRVEEFLGDLKSLEALMQALVEGSAAAAKVVFTVSPSATTKPASLANAGNGAIIQGRPDDIGVVQVGKTADFQTAFQLVNTLEKRLAEAFLVLSVRQSERTTAEEVRMTQMELERQLGGLFSLLTTEFLIPYLNRKMHTLTKSKKIPSVPQNLVKPTIVAGINALGRGQDRESLVQFITTISQTMGPEALAQYLNADEAIKRLAAAQGIDILNLVKSMDERNQEQQQAMQAQQMQSLTDQAGQLAGTPLMDPSKNPDLAPAMQQALGMGGNPQPPQ